MSLFRFQVYAQTDSHTLRLYDPRGLLLDERVMPRTEVDTLVEELEIAYETPCPDLRAIGVRLHRWLDGDTHRWLSRITPIDGVLSLGIDVDARLRHLPWELLTDGGAFLAGAGGTPFAPARLVSTHEFHLTTANRPLRVLFMTCAPEDLTPVLDFEAEEALILQATRKRPLEIEVEESGSLEGLHERVTWFGRGWFDVFHLTGHAGLAGDTPVFHMEDACGWRTNATADQLARAFEGCWPALVFLSGCCTGQAAVAGVFPSLAEALVRAGAPAVLGWALPVRDTTATLAAAELYHQLSEGKTVSEAVGRTRFALLEAGRPDWHLLRLYMGSGQLPALVTPPSTRGRARVVRRPATAEFIDAGARSEVCPAERFVGRRRPIQRALRVLRSQPGEAENLEGVLIHGLGGIGKSSLASRLCDRLAATHQRLVCVGRLDEDGFLKVLGDRMDDPDDIMIINRPGLSLKQRLRSLLEGHLATRALLFVFDDFDYSLERTADGQPCLTAEGEGRLELAALSVLGNLLAAIRETGSCSRVLVTCRYRFSVPGPAQLMTLNPGTLRGAELEKKLRQLEGLAPPHAGVSRHPQGNALRTRAIELAAGMPGLLERLDRVLVNAREETAVLLSRLEEEAAEHRQELLLDQLIALQSPVSQALLARLAVFRVAVGINTVLAVWPETEPRARLARAEALGLVETTLDSRDRTDRHLVPGLVATSIEGYLSPSVRAEVCRLGAEHLYHQYLVGTPILREPEALELHRLALEAGATEIAGETAVALTDQWYDDARFREAMELCRATVRLGENWRVLHALARVEQVLGETDAARQHYARAEALAPELNRESPTTVVKERAALAHNLAGLLAQQGDVLRAMDLWHQSLRIYELIGDLRGKAATLHNVAGLLADHGNLPEALQALQQSFDIDQQIGNMRGTAATLHQMAGVIAQQGDTARALDLWRQSLELQERIGDIRFKAATLHEMAGVIAQQGDISRAMELWQQSLELKERIGAVRGRAATLHQMAWAAGQAGNLLRERALFVEAAMCLARIRAWVDLHTVLSNLGAREAPDATSFLAQALWLSTMVQVPLPDAVATIFRLFMRLGPERSLAPLLARFALWLTQVPGKDHPQAPQLRSQALNLLTSCTQADTIRENDLHTWLESGEDHAPPEFLTELNHALTALVPSDGWVFDPTLVGGD